MRCRVRSDEGVIEVMTAGDGNLFDSQKINLNIIIPPPVAGRAKLILQEC